jgi:HD-GYP domain-containing protein (c-di-GMP phosphodiesterase class II)
MSELTLQTPRDTGASTYGLRERCTSLCLPTWRCDTHGGIVADPTEGGLLGLWLNSAPMQRMVIAAATAWSQERTPRVVQGFPGAWLIPLVERRRRERTGFTVALALSEEALTSEQFLAACGSASLDAQAARRAVQSIAKFDEVAATQAGEMLGWMAKDLAKLHEHDQTVTGFTRQLSDSFETIDLLYSLGRSMNDLTQPQQFLQGVTDRLHTTMCFGWTSSWIAPDARLPRTLTDTMFAAGASPVTASSAAKAASGLFLPGSEPRAAIVPALEGVTVSSISQVLVQPVLRAGRVVGVLMAGDKQGDDPQVSSYDIHLLEAAAGYIGAYLDNAVLYAEQQAMFFGTLEALTASIDAKDRYTCGHSHRVAFLSQSLALASGMTAEQAERVRIAGMVHDVGKIGVPEAVLTKQGHLSDEEFAAIKKHPEIGHRILRDIPLMADVLPGVLYHHERWDGRGYPHGLAGDAIPMIARIISLSDTFDAMSSTRSYRSAMSREKVFEEILRCGGKQFDPALVEPFVRLDFAEYDRLRDWHGAGPAPV